MEQVGTQVETQGDLFQRLESMPGFVEASFRALSMAEAARPALDGGFCPVEHCWHLADLEREGFGERIRRLLVEDSPFLPDFDGRRLAGERGYASRTVMEGLRVFREARAANLARLRIVPPHAWARAGTQEGVGRVTLRDLPRLMAEHDASHRQEIDAWLQEQLP